MSTVVVGCGVFGATAALELRRRGCDVLLLDAGQIPNPRAASTDISKVVRMEYGSDLEYMTLGERARDGWLEWNEIAGAGGHDRLFHETGVAMFCMDPMQPGGFEHDSFSSLKIRGHTPERVADTAVLSRFPAWNRDAFVDGFYHKKGGFAESGRTIEVLVGWLREAGVTVLENTRVEQIVMNREGRVTGVRTDDGRDIPADRVVVAAGAWTSKLVTGLEADIRSTGHPVFHLRPNDPKLFSPERFPTFTADVARTGYYGFPINRDGVVKVAVHALGRNIDANDERLVDQDQLAALRRFLEVAFPALADAPVVYTRLCLYADTVDEHFWISRHPMIKGLTVASGGSGHGFKFAPVLGSLIADAVEGKQSSFGDKFSWRSSKSLVAGQEAARCHIR